MKRNKKPTWDDVIKYCQKKNISPEDFVNMMIVNYKKLKVPLDKLLKLKRNMDRSLN
mgnify:CR=1 FL=1|tara:strand:- start:10 stop:180 length:171 start_codon:yes stop_codon:yes gene_type:complete